MHLRSIIRWIFTAGDYHGNKGMIEPFDTRWNSLQILLSFKKYHQNKNRYGISQKRKTKTA